MMWTLRSPLGQHRAGRRGWIVVTIVASAILAISNTIRPAENLTVSSSGDADGVRRVFAPHWRFDPLRSPYMGNGTCMFGVVHQNDNVTNTPEDIRRRRTCGGMTFVPYEGWAAPNPRIVFERLPNDANIHIVGDSLGQQQATDLMCALASSDARVVRTEPDPTFKYRSATFQSVVGNETKNVTVIRGDGNMGVYAPKRSRRRFASQFDAARKGDIYVVNAGLHYVNKIHGILYDLEQARHAFDKARAVGATVLWRETNAAHFDTPDGYVDSAFMDVVRKEAAECVSSSRFNATASWERFNGPVVPAVRSMGIPVLNHTWESSLLLSEECVIGNGKDCLHFLQPGGTSFWTDALLKYIEEEM